MHARREKKLQQQQSEEKTKQIIRSMSKQFARLFPFHFPPLCLTRPLVPYASLSSLYLSHILCISRSYSFLCAIILMLLALHTI